MYIRPETSRQTKGFTLVETLVALVLLTMALIPIFYLSSTADRISSVVQDDLVGAGLAQEGIEVVVAIRDANWFNSRAFNSGLADGNYIVNNSATALTPWSPNRPLLLSNGLYNYTSGTTTKFYRTIRITNVSASEIKVVSEVAWTTQTNSNKIISVEDHLFNWR